MGEHIDLSLKTGDVATTSFSFGHNFSSLRVFVSLFLFLLPYPIPSELTFLLASFSFYLLSFGSSSLSSSSSSPSDSYTDLESKSDSVGSTIYLASAGFFLALTLFPRLFLADVALSACFLLPSGPTDGTDPLRQYIFPHQRSPWIAKQDGFFTLN